MARKKQPKVIERKLQRHRTPKEREKGVKALGFAHIDDNVIEIDPRQTTFSYFETMVHEMMHLLFPDLSEHQIKTKSNKLTRFLWDHNYRKVHLK